MSRWLAFALGVLTLVFATSARAYTPRDTTYRLSLLTVSPGDALLTRAGHAAIVVHEVWPDGRDMTTVYNYGDANFDDPWLGVKFAWGQPRFFLSVVGDLYDAVERWGLHQNRDVWVQDLAVTSTQAERIAYRLGQQSLPVNREYDYHYLTRTCTTELRTLLDEELGGVIEAQLGPREDEWTIRDSLLSLPDRVIGGHLLDAVIGGNHIDWAFNSKSGKLEFEGLRSS